ncbi:MAG: hypothetical protein LC754_10385 [Acidobacteria bacterium]|nr:hypothetical protein [Acidobacteriota bacterium]
MFDVKNSAGTVVAKVDNAGTLTCGQLSPNAINTGDIIAGRIYNGSYGANWATITPQGTTTLFTPGQPSAIPLTVKGAASQTGDLQQWQNSASTVLARVDPSGGFSTTSHFLSNGSTITAAAGAGAGTAPPAPVVTGATDVRGAVTFGTGATPVAGVQATVTFAAAYPTAPVVVIIPANAATAALQPYVTGTSTTGFSVAFGVAPAAAQANTVYAINYMVIG